MLMLLDVSIACSCHGVPKHSLTGDHLTVVFFMFFASQSLTGEKHENYVCQVLAKAISWLGRPGFSQHLTLIVFMFFASQSLAGEKHASAGGKHLTVEACMFFVSQKLTGEKHENYVYRVFATAFDWFGQPSCSEHLALIVFLFFRQSKVDWRKHVS